MLTNTKENYIRTSWIWFYVTSDKMDIFSCSSCGGGEAIRENIGGVAWGWGPRWWCLPAVGRVFSSTRRTEYIPARRKSYRLGRNLCFFFSGRRKSYILRGEKKFSQEGKIMYILYTGKKKSRKSCILGKIFSRKEKTKYTGKYFFFPGRKSYIHGRMFFFSRKE